MFKPTYVFDKVGEITPDFLAKKHIKGLLLDLDNTLTTHNNPVPPQSSLDWLAKMKAAGIKLMIDRFKQSCSKGKTFCRAVGA